MSRRPRQRSPLLAVRYADLMRTAVARRLITAKTGLYPRTRYLVLLLERDGATPEDVLYV